jgi:hypothetical protein
LIRSGTVARKNVDGKSAMRHYDTGEVPDRSTIKVLLERTILTVVDRACTYHFILFLHVRVEELGVMEMIW